MLPLLAKAHTALFLLLIFVLCLHSGLLFPSPPPPPPLQNCQVLRYAAVKTNKQKKTTERKPATNFTLPFFKGHDKLWKIQQQSAGDKRMQQRKTSHQACCPSRPAAGGPGGDGEAVSGVCGAGSPSPGLPVPLPACPLASFPRAPVPAGAPCPWC